MPETEEPTKPERTTGAPESPTPPRKTNSRARIWLITVIVFAVLLILIALFGGHSGRGVLGSEVGVAAVGWLVAQV